MNWWTTPLDVKRDWQMGCPYEILHVKYTAPSNHCECDACERGREWERAEEELDAAS